jgi:hypothetical protein
MDARGCDTPGRLTVLDDGDRISTYSKSYSYCGERAQERTPGISGEAESRTKSPSEEMKAVMLKLGEEGKLARLMRSKRHLLGALGAQITVGIGEVAPA